MTLHFTEVRNNGTGPKLVSAVVWVDNEYGFENAEFEVLMRYRSVYNKQLGIWFQGSERELIKEKKQNHQHKDLTEVMKMDNFILRIE